MTTIELNDGQTQLVLNFQSFMKQELKSGKVSPEEFALIIMEITMSFVFIAYEDQEIRSGIIARAIVKATELAVEGE